MDSKPVMGREGHPEGNAQPRSLEDEWQDLTSNKMAHGSTEHMANPTNEKESRLDHWSGVLEARPTSLGRRGYVDLSSRM